MEWKDFIDNERNKEYYLSLHENVEKEYELYTCYPKYNEIYNAFKFTKYNDVKVVILGQDPYHEPNQAHGLAFSVLCDKLPPSLINIYKEMEFDLNVKVNQDGNLEYLARQGVLLLNTCLTVRKGMAFSHKDYGWMTFTDNVIKEINKMDRPIVFILWGAPSQKKKALLNNPKHFIIESPHPSPLSAYRGFFGSKPFSKCNEFLVKNGVEPIKWVK
ncbi:MAG: uracil-DNA glycosylase [Acholeplasmatales bacterium]|nr:uracil-DNA glycosylase [Acholeplasmatales bacterium]